MLVSYLQYLINFYTTPLTDTATLFLEVGFKKVGTEIMYLL